MESQALVTDDDGLAEASLGLYTLSTFSSYGFVAPVVSRNRANRRSRKVFLGSIPETARRIICLHSDERIGVRAKSLSNIKVDVYLPPPLVVLGFVR